MGFLPRLAADILLALGDPAWSSGTVQTLTHRAVRLLGRCGVERVVLDEFHHLFDFDKARVMTKAALWLKVLIVNTGIPVVVAGMPEAAYVLSAEHTDRRFKDRLVLACFSWRTPEGRREFCGMLKKLDDTLPLAEVLNLPHLELAGRRHYNAVRRFRANYRRLQVSRLLLQYGLGHGVQARIARELGVSKATVSRDVAAIMKAAMPCPRCGRGLVPREELFTQETEDRDHDDPHEC